MNERYFVLIICEDGGISEVNLSDENKNEENQREETLTSKGVCVFHITYIPSNIVFPFIKYNLNFLFAS